MAAGHHDRMSEIGEAFRQEAHCRNVRYDACFGGKEQHRSAVGTVRYCGRQWRGRIKHKAAAYFAFAK